MRRGKLLRSARTPIVNVFQLLGNSIPLLSSPFHSRRHSFYFSLLLYSSLFSFFPLIFLYFFYSFFAGSRTFVRFWEGKGGEMRSRFSYFTPSNNSGLLSHRHLLYCITGGRGNNSNLSVWIIPVPTIEPEGEPS